MTVLSLYTQVGDDGCYSLDTMLPFLLRVPRHTTPDECLCPSQAALGFGDIVLPALVVASVDGRTPYGSLLQRRHVAEGSFCIVCV